MSLKKILILTIVLVSISALMISCNMGAYPGFKKTKTGVYYKIYKDDNNDTAKVRIGSILTLSLKYGLKDSALFDSKNVQQPIVLPVAESQYEGDFYKCLQLLKQGDSATFVLKAGPLFTKTFGQPAVPAFLTDESDIYFEVKVQKVQTQAEIDKEAEVKNMQLEQEEMIRLQEYVTNNKITVQPTSSGIYFLETKKGTGKTAVKDGYVNAHYTVYLLGGEKLFSTIERGEPVDFKYGSQFENKGFQEVIGMMREGGKANAIVPSAMAFGAQGAGSVVPAFSTLYYEVEMIKIMSNEEFERKQADKNAKQMAEASRKEKEEIASIQKYLKDNNITPTTILPNGLIYIEKQAGTGPKPIDGKKVKVHYTGKLLDGTMFDSSVERGEPFEFALGRRAVIEGWDVGIALMNEGGKATLIIPSKLAYKEKGAGDVIPPFSPLVFDVELIETEK
ncbi:MAG: FKBP-type peptidyl-prolyl cis-trans isomerase [Bacteroidales bacterium]